MGISAPVSLRNTSFVLTLKAYPTDHAKRCLKDGRKNAFMPVLNGFTALYSF